MRYREPRERWIRNFGLVGSLFTALIVAIATAQHADNSAGAAEERGCAPSQIKGNINDEGERIYHVPGSRWYDETRIDRDKGERCFDTVEQAQRAGWRAPKR